MQQDQWELDVLLAEDTESEIQLFEIALQRCGRVRSLNVVRDGAEAIAYFRGQPPFEPSTHPTPNLVVLDLSMPKVNGLEVLDWVQHHPECSVIPTVMFSNSADAGDVEKAYRLGANAFFSKPHTFQELEEILKLILQFWDRALRPVATNPPCR